MLTVNVAFTPPTTACDAQTSSTKGFVAVLELAPATILFLVIVTLGVEVGVPVITIGEVPVTVVTVPLLTVFKVVRKSQS